MSGAEVLGLSHLLMGVTGKYIFKNPDYSGNLEFFYDILPVTPINK